MQYCEQFFYSFVNTLGQLSAVMVSASVALPMFQYYKRNYVRLYKPAPEQEKPQNE
jgi:hypothetical protein